jgi:hypothetical protein
MAAKFDVPVTDWKNDVESKHLYQKHDSNQLTLEQPSE